jgi:hypothetical protein
MAPHHKTIAYIPMDTPHTIDAILSKDLDDPNIHYQSYEDFPPDFYKANYYNFYNDIVKDMLPHESIEDYYPHSVYRPLKIHSYADNGFYYYDEHPQTDFRHASAHSYGPDYHTTLNFHPLPQSHGYPLGATDYHPFHKAERHEVEGHPRVQASWVDEEEAQ